jgi:hypothetical protein
LTNPHKTLIAALLDRSGSMESSKHATQHGWHDLILEQRGEPGLCQLALAQFDTEYELLYPPTDIATVPDLILEPRGRTALHDAVGRFITEVGIYLSALPEPERPGRVICLIMTDGMENASRTWTRQRVRNLISEQRETYNWEFIFLGANIDAVGVGTGMGMDPDQAMTYNGKDYVGNRAAFAASSALMKKVRAGQKSGFTVTDRDAAMGRPPTN